jgi:hypothetical protein
MIRAASWYTGSHVDPSKAAPASSNSMPKRLIIVESPSKARTLAKFLGSDYTIKASMGHVRDLPKSRLGVDLEGGFAPEYEVTRETQIRDLRSAARGAEGVLLASDPDREGEAIAWHLAEALKLKNPERVVFHEITRPAVEAARPSCRLPAQPAAVEEGAHRAERRPGAVGRSAPGRRSRARDRGVRARGVLDRRGPARDRRRRGFHGPALFANR